MSEALGTQIAGLSQAHDSAVEHVTGSARYVDDMESAQGMLHVAIGTSAIAHGNLLSLNLDKVRQADGVVDVITFQDLAHTTDIGPVFPGDPLLVDKTISHAGQALFAVAARSHRQARQAILLAQTHYDEQEPVLDITEAVENRVFVRPPHTMQRGDSAAALKNATHRLAGELHIGGQEHFYLEGQVARARPEEDGGVTVWSSNQNPTEAQHLVANVLGIDMHRVNVVVRRMGGGFGGKETHATACAVFAALFARRNGVSVNCRLSRRDDMIMTGKRHGFLCRYDVGFDVEGRITAIEYVLAGQCGHSPDLSDAIVDRAMFHSDNAYYLPDVTIEGLRCKTHTVSNTAFRGFGGPQGMMAMETVIDEIAFAVDKDPLQIRRLNLYGESERNITPYHQIVETFTVPRLLDELEASSDYQRRREAIREFNAGSDIHKKGIALTPVKFGISFTVKHLNQAGALLHVYSDGSAQLNHGGTEMGQGLMVKVQQIVAQELGMSLDRIAVMATRTDKVPNSSATAASSGTDLNGMAALHAAREIRQRLTIYLQEKHGAEAGSVQFLIERISVSDGEGRTIAYTWPELAMAAYRDRISLSATGYYRTPKIHYDREQARGQPFYYYANGAAVSEVLIDTLTGETELLRTDILHDVGRSINPAIDIGQVEGGFVQGAGWLTHEQLCWDDKGQLLTDGPATYKIPAIGDMPKDFRVSLLTDSPNDAATVFHSKAVGEPPLMLAISVFAAIRDAIASIGNHEEFPSINAPATPEEILRVCTELRARIGR
ncbi:MAG: xanthine dehydrogenase molybdopterin binding subunit [Granulosicoccus sp.]